MYLGAGASPQAWGQNKLWVLLAMVLEQSPQPAEHSHRDRLSRTRLCYSTESGRCSGEKRPISAIPGRAPGQGAFKKNQQQKEEVSHLSEGFILGSVLATLVSVVVIKHQDQSHSKKRVGTYSSRGAKRVHHDSMVSRAEG